jgi:hypothetical protein
MIEYDLNSLWFLLIAVLWMGYFFLEGFDFGVGILLPFVGRDDLDRRVAIRTIGPMWDGNEVWLIVAGAATFAGSGLNAGTFREKEEESTPQPKNSTFILHLPFSLPRSSCPFSCRQSKQ